MASSVTSRSLSLFLFTSKPSSSPSAAAATTHLLFPSLRTNACFAPLTLNPRGRGRSIIVRVDEADDRGGQDEYDMVNEEVDNKKDYDVEYDRSDGDIAFVQIKSFTSTQGWNSEMVVDYRINEDGFHKIMFIRKPPDPDNDV